LFDFIEREEFVSTFQWQLGDLIIWDNRMLAHKSGRIHNDPVSIDAQTPQEEDTMVYRISVQDPYPLSVVKRTVSHIHTGTTPIKRMEQCS
jgi:taurine dioxygenase